MTMELLDGEPLSRLDRLEQRLNKSFDRSDLVRQFAEGLAYAHSQGVVHCDLKPDNVFVTTSGRVKVLDFGIARLTQEAEQADQYDAGRLGALTRRFASVEMLLGNTESHPADDVYALGLIGWWLFSGEHAYGGTSADEALAQNLAPAGTSQEWRERERKALLRAVRLTREARQSDAGQFLAMFQGIAQRNRLLAGLALLLILVTGGWLYQTLAPTGPEVPFAQLPPETQQAFTESLAQGYAHLEISDIDGALRYFDAAWLLHPWNAEAVDALDALVDRVTVLFADARSPEMATLLKPSLEAMRSNPYLADQDDLNQLSEAVSKL
jgi:serine/threonine protein kinase